MVTRRRCNKKNIYTSEKIFAMVILLVRQLGEYLVLAVGGILLVELGTCKVGANTVTADSNDLADVFVVAEFLVVDSMGCGSSGGIHLDLAAPVMDFFLLQLFHSPCQLSFSFRVWFPVECSSTFRFSSFRLTVEKFGYAKLCDCLTWL